MKNQDKNNDAVKVVKKRKKASPEEIHIKKLRKIKKSINIFNSFNYYGHYLFQPATINDKDFKSEVVIFDFADMREAMDFYRAHEMSRYGWQCISGENLLKEYNFTIIRLRKKLLMEKVENEKQSKSK